MGRGKEGRRKNRGRRNDGRRKEKLESWGGSMEEQESGVIGYRLRTYDVTEMSSARKTPEMTCGLASDNTGSLIRKKERREGRVVQKAREVKEW